MSNPRLGSIVRVDPRSVWPNEARNFTPWLADNLDALAEALGLELDLESQEAPVGDFALDLLARDLGRDAPVVIENQLEPTDHDHLGKLLTYASGYDASAVVWISPEFREEHRQTLDWLNQRTDSDTDFFGVQVELLKVDDSLPAPSLRLVVMPNEWKKRKGGRGGGPVSPRAEKYRAFFQDLIDELRERHRFTRARVGQPQNWYSFASGHSGLNFSASFAQGDRLRVELYIDFGDESENLQLFERLHADKTEIEEALGGELSWERLDDSRACRIGRYRNGSIDDDEETLQTAHEWMIEQLLEFKRVFGPRLKRLLS